MTKKNIALIIPSLRGGGAERTVSRLSFALKKDYNLYVIIFNNKSVKFAVEGKVIDLQIPATNNITLKLIYFFKKIIKLRKIKRQYKIDVSISFMEGPNITNILSRVDDKVYISVRNLLSKSSRGWEIFYWPFIRLLYNRSDQIISLSNTLKEDLIKNYKIDPKKLKIVYNFINLKNIKSKMLIEIDDSEKNIFKKDVIINIGRLTKQKGQVHLIKAFKYINENNPDINLVILGTGELYKYFKDLIKKLNLENNVYLLGFKVNPYRYLYRSKLYVNTSLYEGFGNVLIEAMCCELPVIAASCPSGINEILGLKDSSDFNGQLEHLSYGIITSGFNKSNACSTAEKEKTLACTIIELLNDEEKFKYYQNRSIERARHFKQDNIISKWQDLIDYDIKDR